MGTAESNYTERPSRIPGAVVWRLAPHRSHSSRILPDGCMDVIHSDGELFVAGPDTTAHLTWSAAGRRSTAVRFAPGTGPAFLGVAASELRNRRVPLRDLWPSGRVRRLTERLDEASDRASLLEDVLLAVEADPDPLATRVLAHLRTGHPVAGVAAEIGMSERQLHRRGLFLYGYGLKTLDRILRLNGALDQARRGMAYAAVAANSGYADQAHLSREVKALTGITLSELLK
ncbi:AraC family transcriptional regulator [Dactylosporangium salmoneum]|uniref:Helix-turn-helix transcriptional regulator n=1 Tax=Dactylosporangium salmoneum TaxID=53361 RepID=A0ABN3GGD0_9ACTN